MACGSGQSISESNDIKVKSEVGQSTEESESENNTSEESSWEYYEENETIPTPNSSVMGVAYYTHFSTEGHNTYSYILSPDEEKAQEQFQEYLMIFRRMKGYEVNAAKGSMALIQKDKHSICGVGVHLSEERNQLVVLFFD